jgi:hypothetical protein
MLLATNRNFTDTAVVSEIARLPVRPLPSNYIELAAMGASAAS